nr:uncharacterized protein LOC109159890 [Ipomoea batatas]
MKVSALIDSHTKDWNTNIIHEIFYSKDVDLILKLLVAAHVEDMCWKGDLRGVIPTMVALVAREMEVDVLCPLRRQSPESLLHIYYGVARMLLPYGLNLLDVLFQCLWRERNAVIFNQKTWQPLSIHMEVLRLVDDWLRLGAMPGSRSNMAQQIIFS